MDFDVAICRPMIAQAGKLLKSRSVWPGSRIHSTRLSTKLTYHGGSRKENGSASILGRAPALVKRPDIQEVKKVEIEGSWPARRAASRSDCSLIDCASTSAAAFVRAAAASSCFIIFFSNDTEP